TVAAAAQPAVAWAINHGVAIEPSCLEQLRDNWKRQYADGWRRWQAIAPEVDPFKPSQMQPWLRTRLTSYQLAQWPPTAKAGRLSTDEDTLIAWAAEIRELEPVRDIFKARRAVANLIKLREFIHPVTGRLHSDYMICGARTGRMSSSHPALQA